MSLSGVLVRLVLYMFLGIGRCHDDTACATEDLSSSALFRMVTIRALARRHARVWRSNDGAPTYLSALLKSSSTSSSSQLSFQR